jgi:hypothetical protein
LFLRPPHPACQKSSSLHLRPRHPITHLGAAIVSFPSRSHPFPSRLAAISKVPCHIHHPKATSHATHAIKERRHQVTAN